MSKERPPKPTWRERLQTIAYFAYAAVAGAE